MNKMMIIIIITVYWIFGLQCIYYNIIAVAISELFAFSCTGYCGVQADEIKVRMTEKRMMTKAKAIQSFLTQLQYVYHVSVDMILCELSSIRLHIKKNFPSL